ncbi:MAG: Sir2 family NAD-dependent protein deacetylase [Sulfurimonas sp.]|nr:Sir2 family NAD-dependent protein deacetylase [Sulfurimonas sp.]
MAKVIILTGAGISAESGLRTFRDMDGYWNEHKIKDVCSAGALAKNREKVLDFYDERRTELKNIEPNKVHKVIAQLKDTYTDDIAIITQNVDDLFERANCNEVIHLHGFLSSIRCRKCNYKEDIAYQEQNRSHRCPKCKNTLRPDIVFFNEAAPMYRKLYMHLNSCEMLVVIGTSGNVIDVDDLLNNKIKLTILNNLEPSTAIDDKLYNKVLYKKATEAIEEIALDIEKFLAL